MRVLWTLVWALGCLICGGLRGETVPFETETLEGFDFVLIPAGQFQMGTSRADQENLEARGWWNRFLKSEQPDHLVVIPEPFLMATTEVTQKQWKDVMGKAHEESTFKGDDRPVESVSYAGVQSFLRRLNARSPHRFRLPSEAEWEYGCRAGAWGLFPIGDDGRPVSADTVGDFCWMKSNAAGKTQPVGTRRPNAWGLYDMIGNVWEWCEDTYHRGAYETRQGRVVAPKVDREFPERVVRGGSWYLPMEYQRSALRSGFVESERSSYVGFRLVCERAEGPKENEKKTGEQGKE